jgi:hypothetical protein
MTAPDEQDKAAHLALPRETTPTWEVELLISGVAVFAMLQLPELLDRVVLDWSPRFIDRWAKLLQVIYLYAKSAALILAATFVIHLLLRARWIALVGMLSIYPKGVDWDKLHIGPNARDIESTRMGRMEDSIERADNRATMVFATGVVLASILFAITLGIAVLLGGALWIDTQFGIPINASWIAWAFALFIVPYAAAMFVDRSIGARLVPGGWAQRLLRGALRGYARIGLGMSNNPAMALLATHHGRRRTILLTIIVFMLAVSAASTSFLYARNPGLFGSYARFPDPDQLDARNVDPSHYDDRRDIARELAVPYIQSPVIRGPYVQLVVPYVPDRDGVALQKQCPNADDAMTLACLQRNHPVLLDEKPLAVTYDVGQDARTNRPALVAMIDVRTLPRGRHLLRIGQPPHHEDAEDTFIPFWR